MVLGAALVLGACGSNATDDAVSVDESAEAPAELALDATAPDQTQGSADDAAEAENDLSAIEVTPELFEQLKTDEVQRAEVLEEMSAQGLSAEEAECFLDNVSPGLFVTFGTGAQPDDDQFAELLQLLDTCEIAFGAES